MANSKLVQYHVMSSVRVAMAESNGYHKSANRLRAQANLRLMVMSEEELQELAQMLSFLPLRAPEDVYGDIKQAIEDHQQTACDWIGAIGVEPYGPVSA